MLNLESSRKISTLPPVKFGGRCACSLSAATMMLGARPRAGDYVPSARSLCVLAAVGGASSLVSTGVIEQVFESLGILGA